MGYLKGGEEISEAEYDELERSMRDLLEHIDDIRRSKEEPPQSRRFGDVFKAVNKLCRRFEDDVVPSCPPGITTLEHPTGD